MVPKLQRLIVAAILIQVSWILIGSANCATAQPAEKSGLTRLLEAELSRLPAKSGIYIKHLKTGEEASVLADEPFESASTIKVGIMALAYRLADEGKLDLDQRIELKVSDMRGGSGIYRYKDLGLDPTVRDLITEMIITSDNTATDKMIAIVGGKEKIDEFYREFGSVSRQIRTTNEYFRLRYEIIDEKYKSLPPEDVFALCCASTTVKAHEILLARREVLNNQIERDSAGRDIAERISKLGMSPANWFGATTPREMGRLLESIELCTIAVSNSCDEMKRILLGQKSGALKIPHYIQVPVGHKTGETRGVTNDVGIIYSRSGPIVISFYNMNVVGPRADTEDRMGEVSRLIVEYFDGAD